MHSPNQVLTHAARAAAKQLNKVPFQAPLVAARGARRALVRVMQCALSRLNNLKGSKQAENKLDIVVIHLVGALSAKMEINHCPIKHISRQV